MVEVTIEEWAERFASEPGLTITHVIMSRRAAALAETVRAPFGKRLSIRARRRWQGRARAWLRRMS
ncbi:hypothetical protein ASF34_20025 [Methylobacterium sp. Leaf106]|nr:hypothetical protein ASF34_20025 [Methylobacterium sp. Leaf106]